jgi:hypothetical protein
MLLENFVLFIGASFTKAVAKTAPTGNELFLRACTKSLFNDQTRSMAKAQGLSEATIRRIWKQHNLKPHLLKTFAAKISSSEGLTE